jgi:DNA-binding CsgD family transcriptional regulator/tetratricopeptide (TPR) repeat protein
MSEGPIATERSADPGPARRRGGHGMTRPMAVPLVARTGELEELQRLLRATAAGQGGAVLVVGEAGIGKSALLDAVADGLDGWLVLRASGAEFESDLSYAALHQLLAPVIDHRAALPDPQRVALETVLGLRADPGPPPDVLLIGLATLGVLCRAARTQPVCCVLDDVQWMDSASRRVIGFAARRVSAERVAVLLAARDAATVADLAGVPTIVLEGLADADATALLRSVAGGAADAEILARVLAEAHGNPLALKEFGRVHGPSGAPTEPGGGVPAKLTEQFVRRLRELPDTARELVELASAEPVGDMALLRRSATVLQLDPRDLAVAEAEGLIRLGPTLRFQHPLIRSAAYVSVPPERMRRIHAALADATDQHTDPDRRAWHRALAVAGTDEAVAVELTGSADRAIARGGFTAAAALLERAARMTPDRDRRTERLLAAARATVAAGAPAAARVLVDEVDRAWPGSADLAESRRLRALIDFHVLRSPEATTALVEAAADLEPVPARQTYLEAFSSAMFVDRLPGRLRRLAEQIRAQVPPPEAPLPVDLLLDALLDQVLLPVDKAVPTMRAAVAACAAPEPAAGPWWMELAALMAMDLRDAVAMDEISARQVAAARRQGAFAVLPQALRYRAIALAALGRFATAQECLTEAKAVDEAADTISLAFADLIIAAWQGDAERYAELTTALRQRIGRLEVVSELYATAVLRNGLGEYQAALEAALAARDQHDEGSYVVWHLDQELVEAAARAGQPELAEPSLARIAALATASPTPWAVATDLVARAFLACGPEAEALYREALDLLAATPVRIFHARTRLLYGEWLRRAGRRSEARVELRAAHEALTAFGSKAFAERAARELLATGERARRSDPTAAEDLTAQEQLIAARVGAGATSREVAEALFLSPRTVDTHLRNIYRKLGISSRRQLRGLHV